MVRCPIGRPMMKMTLTRTVREGFLAGSASAGRNITSDPESRKRIETAFRRFRADVLRKEADALDKGDKMEDMMF